MQDQTRSSPPSSSERSSSSAPQTDSKEGMDSDEEIGRVPEFGMEQGGPSTSGGEQAAAGTSSEPAQSSSAAQASARRHGRSPADKEHRRLKRFKSDEKSLADALDRKKVETERLRDEKLNLMKKHQEANSAALDLQSEINKKEVEMGLLQTEVNEKALFVYKLSHITKEKDQEIKSWEEQSAKKDVSHDNEVKQLDAQLVEQAVKIK